MKLFKRFICLIFILTMLPLSAFALPEPPLIEASAYLIAERNSNTLLLEHNIDEKLFPASITKLTTALVAVNHLKPDDVLTVKKEDIAGLYEQGSSVFLKEGEEIVFSELLKYLLIASGNDAANLIARTISGNIDDFAQLMTDTVKSFGCENTNYTNPTGLHNENHYSSARDIYLIGLEVLKNPTLTEICSIDKLIFPKTNKHDETTFYSTNHLLSKYKDNRYFLEEVSGLKTGWTGPAGMCLIATASKNDLDIVTVVLNAPKRDDGSQGSFTETTKLLNFAFGNYKKDLFIPQTEPICEVTVGLAKKENASLVLTLKEDYVDILSKDVNRSDISIVHLTDADIVAPISKGDVLGTASITYDGKTRATIDLIAANDVERSQSAYVMSRIKGFFSSKLLKLIIGACSALIILLIIIRYVNVSNRRKRRGGRYRK